MKENQKKLDSLEKALLSFDARRLSNERKNVVKNAVFKRCNFDLIDRLNSLDSAELNVLARVSVKERMFDIINSGVNTVFWSFRRLVKFSASFAVFMFAFFAIFNFITVDQGVVFATRPSVFKNVTGKVLLERGGEMMIVEDGMFVFEGDRILTNGGGVTIRFFDNTESRLGKSSEVVIDKLHADERNEAMTEVEISVINGDVWSNVVNLVGDSAFKVKADEVEAVVDRSAAFNIHVKPHYSAVTVYDDVVKVKAKKFNGHVVKGNVVSVDDTVKTTDVEVHDVVDEKWVADNLSEDIVHEDSVGDELLEDKIRIAAIADSDNVVIDKSLNVQPILDDVKDMDSMKKGFEVVERQFVAADLTLNMHDAVSDIVDAKESMMEFKNVVENYYDRIDDLRDTDEELANEMKEYIDGRIDVLEKSVALSEPGSPEYLGVEVLSDLKVSGANTDEELADVKVEIGLDKLADVDDVLESGDVELAAEVLSEGVAAIEEAGDIITDVAADITPEYLVALDVAQDAEADLNEVVEADIEFDNDVDVLMHDSAEEVGVVDDLDCETDVIDDFGDENSGDVEVEIGDVNNDVDSLS